MQSSSASYDFGRLMSSSKPDVDFESYINATTRGKSGDTGRVDVDRGVAPEVEVVVKVEPSESDPRHAHAGDGIEVEDDDVQVMFEVSEEYDPDLLVGASFTINESTWRFMEKYNQADFSQIASELYDGLDFEWEMDVPVPDEVHLYDFDREVVNSLCRRCRREKDLCPCPRGRYRRMYAELALTELAVEVVNGSHVAA